MRTVLATHSPPLSIPGGRRSTYGSVAAPWPSHGTVDLVYGAFGASRSTPPSRRSPTCTFTGSRDRAARPPARPTFAPAAPASPRLRQRSGRRSPARGRSSRARGPARCMYRRGPRRGRPPLPLVGSPAAYCAHNLESSFRHRLDESKMSRTGARRFERLLLDRFDGELDGLRRRHGRAPAALAPGRTAAPGPQRRRRRRDRSRCHRGRAAHVLFVADFTYEPNRDGPEFLSRGDAASSGAGAPRCG